MRLAGALLALLALGCGGETAGAPAGTDWLVTPGTDTTGVAARLGAFADGSVPDAFARLAEQPYRVEVTLVDLDPARDDADTLGLFEQTLEVSPGEALRVTTTTARGSLADSAGLDAARLLPRDPFPELLPDGAPPFLDRRTRGAYRVSMRETNIGAQTIAEVADPDAERPLVRRAVAWDQLGERRTLSVARASESAIYDERSSAFVELRTARAELPQRVETHVETATPLRRRHLVTTWTITPLGARPAQPDTTSPREP